MNVVFEDSNEIKTIIGVANSRVNAWKILMNYLKEKGFKSHYQRCSIFPEERRVWIDFGSHVCFAHFTDLTDAELKDFYGELV